jgi:hypothetical protein
MGTAFQGASVENRKRQASTNKTRGECSALKVAIGYNGRKVKALNGGNDLNWRDIDGSRKPK